MSELRIEQLASKITVVGQERAVDTLDRAAWDDGGPAAAHLSAVPVRPRLERSAEGSPPDTGLA